MTYGELGEEILKMNPEQLNMDISAYLIAEDEYFQVSKLKFTRFADVLDKNHPYLVVNTGTKENT